MNYIMTNLKLGELREFYVNYSRKALSLLEECLQNGTKKDEIMRLCEEVCFGKRLELGEGLSVKNELAVTSGHV